jgi:serine/threonine protein kinase
VRLGDFGCSQPVSGNFLGGSVPFMSPEVVCGVENFSKFRSDIWSLGVTFYVMAVGRLPWRGIGSDNIKAEIRLGVCPNMNGIDPRITSLVRSAMIYEPSRRASLESLIEMVAGWPTPSGMMLKNLFAAPSMRRSHINALRPSASATFRSIVDHRCETPLQGECNSPLREIDESQMNESEHL